MAPFYKLVSIIAFVSIAFDFSLAHPGHDHQAEAEKRAAQIAASSRRSLSHCAEKLKARGHEANAIARRSAWAQELRQKRSLENLPFLRGRAVDPLSISHKSNRTDLTANSTDDQIFGSNTGGCVLQPEVTEGPYCTLSLPTLSPSGCTHHIQMSTASSSAMTSMKISRAYPSTQTFNSWT